MIAVHTLLLCSPNGPAGPETLYLHIRTEAKPSFQTQTQFFTYVYSD